MENKAQTHNDYLRDYRFVNDTSEPRQPPPEKLDAEMRDFIFSGCFCTRAAIASINPSSSSRVIVRWPWLVVHFSLSGHQLKLFGGELIALDGTKPTAVNIFERFLACYRLKFGPARFGSSSWIVAL